MLFEQRALCRCGNYDDIFVLLRISLCGDVVLRATSITGGNDKQGEINLRNQFLKERHVCESKDRVAHSFSKLC